MRLTTKIMIGIISSIFLLTIGFIIGFSFTDRKFYTNTSGSSYISQKNIKGIEVKPYRTVLLQAEGEDFIYFRGGLHFRPQTEEKENKLFVSEELGNYIIVESKTDTLVVTIEREKLRQFQNKDNDRISHIAGSNFYIYNNKVDVINRTSGIDVDIKDINTPLIKVKSHSDINIDNCTADTIVPYLERYKTFRLKNSKVKTLNIDLDYVANWHVENCEIEVENLTGNNNHHVYQSKNEAKLMNWIPKRKEAELNIRLSGDTAKLVFQ